MLQGFSRAIPGIGQSESQTAPIGGWRRLRPFSAFPQMAQISNPSPK
jgi:hypothetical protein